MKKEKNKKYFERLGAALNPQRIRVTRDEKRQSINFLGFLDFLSDSRQFLLDLKGKLTSGAASGVDRCHKRAVQLGLLKYGKPSPRGTS